MPMQPKPCMDTTRPSGPSVLVGSELSVTDASLLHVDRRDDVADRSAPRLRTPARGIIGQPLDGDVGRGRDGVLPAEQRDFAVEVVGLDAAEPTSQALPRRPTTTRAALDRRVLHLLTAPGNPLIVPRPVDARGGETGLRLNAQHPVEITHQRHLA